MAADAPGQDQAAEGQKVRACNAAKDQVLGVEDGGPLRMSAVEPGDLPARRIGTQTQSDQANRRPPLFRLGHKAP